jgi:hypothetical protein
LELQPQVLLELLHQSQMLVRQAQPLLTSPFRRELLALLDQLAPPELTELTVLMGQQQLLRLEQLQLVPPEHLQALQM